MLTLHCLETSIVPARMMGHGQALPDVSTALQIMQFTGGVVKNEYMCVIIMFMPSSDLGFIIPYSDKGASSHVS